MVDLTDCDREPIHIPGAIQAHGVLMVLEEPALTVVQVSENVAMLLSRGVEAVLGKPLATAFDSASVERVRDALREDNWHEVNPLRIDANGKRLDGILHRHAGAAILELELVTEPPRPMPMPHPFRTVLLRMQRVRTLAELAEVVVVNMQRVTGFERVLFYRFHDDGHGSVDAEAKESALESYLGQHYPASDIPAQARQLYLDNWLRLIVDGRAPAARIVSARGGGPLDLSFAVLRSVSPVHLEYMANMGVRASMSVSLIVRDRLWGLLSCLNHSGPRHVPHDIRAACEFLGRLTSLQIAALDDRDLLALRAARRVTQHTLCETMRATTDGVLDGLLADPEQLMGLVDASGVAVVGSGETATRGRTPPPALVEDIATWVCDREGPRPFSTESLGSLFPPALAAADVASGLLTFALPGEPQRRLLWFRPEVIDTVKWGGNPSKSVSPDASGRLRPRHSFALWREEVRYRSRPWTASDLEAADDLLRCALEIDLERRLSGEQRAVRARDELIAVVSHDLRNPLSAIVLQADSMHETAHDDRTRSSVERIRRSASHAKALIDDLLDLARIEAQSFVVHRSSVDSRAMIEEALLGVAPMADVKHIALAADLLDSPQLEVDGHQIMRVLMNLLGNAIKFTPDGGKVTVRAQRSGTDLMITVADTGPGILAEHLPWLFERYWQARPASHVGAGLGLYVARGIVAAHGGRIWAESTAAGARLTFTLPL